MKHEELWFGESGMKAVRAALFGDFPLLALIRKDQTFTNENTKPPTR